MNRKIKSEDVAKALAPIQPILAEERVWEVMIDGHERVLIERKGKLEQVAAPFASAEELSVMIEELFGLYGIQLDAENPVGYLSLPDHSLVTAIVPPNAADGPHLVLRRLVGRQPTWEELIAWDSVPQGAYDLLKSAVAARMNILVAGGNASGKTTFANRLAELFPSEERLIIVEEIYEMQVEHPRVVRLEAGGPAGLPLEEVLTAATRMRPDRLIVGQLAGPIAAAVLQHFGGGLDGSMTIIHGASVEDALHRLESLCLMADLGLGLPEIRRLIAAGLHLITYQERLPDGRRKLVEIVELRGVEDHRYILQPLMRYHRDTEQFEFTGM